LCHLKGGHRVRALRSRFCHVHGRFHRKAIGSMSILYLDMSVFYHRRFIACHEGLGALPSVR
jgi:hypothetical protein